MTQARAAVLAVAGDATVSCVIGDAHERLSGRSVHDAWYRVPAASVQQFETLQRRAEEIYRRHALSWTVEHDTQDVEYWRESGPRFREQADLRAAAEEFDAQPGLLDRLAEFRLEHPPGATVFDGGWSYLSISPARRYETVMHAGLDRRDYDLPPVDPASMTDAMRLAQRLARVLAPRLNDVVPRPFSVRAANELVIVDRDDEPVRRQNLIDLEIEPAAHGLLDAVQEFLTEELTVPWPHDPTRGYAFHEPRVEIRGGALRMWYGAERDPVLRIEPIPVAELTDA